MRKIIKTGWREFLEFIFIVALVITTIWMIGDSLIGSYKPVEVYHGCTTDANCEAMYPDIK